MASTPILTLSPEIAQQIRAHGAETYPHECCGALLGRDLDVTAASSDGHRQPSREIIALFPLINRRDDSPRNRFSVTSDDVRDAEKAARQKGLDVMGWYHSHPDHPAKPSEFDREHAWPWYSYIIVSVANGNPEYMTSWRLSDDRQQMTSEDLAIGGAAKTGSTDG
jgi:proteasome lid subunit RPN8/RPN11